MSSGSQSSGQSSGNQAVMKRRLIDSVGRLLRCVGGGTQALLRSISTVRGSLGFALWVLGCGVECVLRSQKQGNQAVKRISLEERDDLIKNLIDRLITFLPPARGGVAPPAGGWGVARCAVVWV
mgnify:CR=1 FL=1